MTGIPAQEALRIVVAHGDPAARAALTALLSGHPALRIVAETADGPETWEAARHHRPDTILPDVRLPGLEASHARVVWAEGQYVGCAFIRPLHPAVLEMIVANSRRR